MTTATIIIEKISETYLRVFSEPAIEQEISDFFKFRVPGYQFMPMYKNHLWDGFVKLFNIQKKTLYAGLYPYISEFAKQHEYSIDFQPNQFYQFPFLQDHINPQTIQEFCQSLQLSVKGKEIIVKDYQLDAICHAINNYRCVLVSSTGSGKSLIIYCIIRYLQSQIENCKILLIVPNINLVEQFYSDMNDYSGLDDSWNVKTECQKIYGKYTKEIEKSIIISDWQSIYKFPREFFNQFTGIIQDEAHLGKAASLTSIFEKSDQVKYRIGTTGTIDNKIIHKLVLEGLMGPVYQVTTTKDLMDSNNLANLKIKCVLLKHDQTICKELKDAEFQDEIKYIVGCEKRNKFIRNLALKLQGNTLIMFNYIERHGLLLYELLSSIECEKRIYLVTGVTEISERERIRKLVAEDSTGNSIICCSFGVWQQGVNVPSLKNIIFASPSDSKIRVLQSLGRGLRYDESIGKTHCTLYDIGDNLCFKKHKNFGLKHFMNRISLYSEEKFDMTITEVNL